MLSFKNIIVVVLLVTVISSVTFASPSTTSDCVQSARYELSETGWRQFIKLQSVVCADLTDYRTCCKFILQSIKFTENKFSRD